MKLFQLLNSNIASKTVALCLYMISTIYPIWINFQKKKKLSQSNFSFVNDGFNGNCRINVSQAVNFDQKLKTTFFIPTTDWILNFQLAFGLQTDDITARFIFIDWIRTRLTRSDKSITQFSTITRIYINEKKMIYSHLKSQIR